ncbi:hypothetical protein P280DRAFT_544470 [Massarina eburnea CBS 473.64]|uniref:Uncharacterized protein n=1 Tax=Massarina eburnea CBS 473.64 TaxID=1395130 RepID=A0A6A6SFJ2_9PLEO|nr:hypothetical protein P280DRAFT_544470 [Massarina eburnea CBS 473.64]
MASHSTTFSPLLSLPLELRGMIWKECFTEKRTAVEPDDAWNPSRRLGRSDIRSMHPTNTASMIPLPLSKELYHETREAYYNAMRFRTTQPEAFRSFYEGKSERNAMIKRVEIGVSCLFITNGTVTSDRLTDQKSTEHHVNAELRAWGKIFDNWDTFGFTVLDEVHINFQQWVKFMRRTEQNRPFTDCDELHRLFYKIANSTLVTNGRVKKITQSGLWTMGAFRAFEQRIEIPAAHAVINKDFDEALDRNVANHAMIQHISPHDSNPTPWHELHSRRSADQAEPRTQALAEATNKIHRANHLTAFELLALAARTFGSLLAEHDAGRHGELRERHMADNDGHVTNYAMQAVFAYEALSKKIDYEERGQWDSWWSDIIASCPHDTFLDAWLPDRKEEGQGTTNKVWYQAVYADMRPLYPRLPYLRLEGDELGGYPFLNDNPWEPSEEALWSRSYASGFGEEEGLAGLVDEGGFMVKMDEVGPLDRWCLCSECGRAVADGLEVPHGEGWEEGMLGEVGGKVFRKMVRRRQKVAI